MRLSEAGRQHIMILNEQLGSLQANGIPYDNIQLSEGGFTEVVVPSGGLPMMEAIGYAGYWPGGFPDGQNFAMVVSDDPLDYVKAEQASVLRDQINQMRLSEVALARFAMRSIIHRPETEVIRTHFADRLMPSVILACEQTGNPLSYLMIGKWILPKKYGTLYGANLHFPVGVMPAIALRNLQEHAGA